MKANNIKALNYQTQGETLILQLEDTSLEEITKMDPAVLQITTDDGDLVEAFAGYRVGWVTYEVSSGTYVATLTQGAEDTTAAALAALSTDQAELRTQINEQADALIELAALLTEEA